MRSDTMMIFRKAALRLVLAAAVGLTLSTVSFAETTSAPAMKGLYGRTLQAAAPAGAGPVTWTSSNPSVASVDALGHITLKRRGEATVSAVRGANRVTIPVTVSGFSRLARTIGNRACAVDDERTGLYCWGRNLWTLPFDGVGLTSSAPAPRRISRGDLSPTDRIADVSVGVFAACALTETGAVHCFGSGADHTPLGRAIATASPQKALPPTRVDLAGASASAIAVGPSSACAALSDATMRCWGQGPEIPQSGPLRKNGFVALPFAAALGAAPAGAISRLSVSTNGGCLLAGGDGYCWSGSGLPAKLDRGDRSGAPLTDIVSDDFHCALDQGGQAYCAGLAFGARYGRGQATFLQSKAWLAVDQSQAGMFSRLSQGGVANVTCGLSQAGDAWCWGRSHLGSAGDGAAADHDVLRPTQTLRGARPADVVYTDVSCGQYHCLALGDDGRIYGWGSNEGQVLGPDPTGRFSSAAQPVLIAPPV